MKTYLYTGYVFKLGGAAIAWESKKQRTVALSSTEAEYMGLSEAAKEAIYLKSLLRELLGKSFTVALYNDNQGAQKLAYNPVFHKRTKHIDIRHHFIRDAVENKEVILRYLSTGEMLADILTKGVSKPKHELCIKRLGME